jgi:protein-arginine kinase activator protein McsA
MQPEATPEQALCEVCHERRAIHHICYGGTGKSSHLCEECFEKSATLEERESTAAMREAHCQYCGGQPCAAGIDLFALAKGIQQMKYMCMPCSMEYHQYIQQEARGASSNLPPQEQLAAFLRLSTQADQHMRQWVSERESS